MVLGSHKQSKYPYKYNRLLTFTDILINFARYEIEPVELIRKPVGAARYKPIPIN